MSRIWCWLGLHKMQVVRHLHWSEVFLTYRTDPRICERCGKKDGWYR